MRLEVKTLLAAAQLSAGDRRESSEMQRVAGSSLAVGRCHFLFVYVSLSALIMYKMHSSGNYENVVLLSLLDRRLFYPNQLGVQWRFNSGAGMEAGASRPRMPTGRL